MEIVRHDGKEVINFEWFKCTFLQSLRIEETSLNKIFRQLPTKLPKDFFRIICLFGTSGREWSQITKVAIPLMSIMWKNKVNNHRLLLHLHVYVVAILFNVPVIHFPFASIVVENHLWFFIIPFHYTIMVQCRQQHNDIILLRYIWG